MFFDSVICAPSTLRTFCFLVVISDAQESTAELYDMVTGAIRDEMQSTRPGSLENTQAERDL